MDGLEVKEVPLSEVYNNKDARIDSGFYTTHIFRNETLHYEQIGKCLLSTQYGISKDMNTENKGYPIFRMNELHYGLCESEQQRCGVFNRMSADRKHEY